MKLEKLYNELENCKEKKDEIFKKMTKENDTFLKSILVEKFTLYTQLKMHIEIEIEITLNLLKI